MGTLICELPGCNKPKQKQSYNRGWCKYCSTHVRKESRWSTRKPGHPPILIGSSWIEKTTGYRLIMVAGKRVYVHRLVDAITNGPIPKGWDVHHNDEIKLNNHWTNLQRMPKAEHAALHGRSVWH
jgi:hypothetical protein